MTKLIKQDKKKEKTIIAVHPIQKALFELLSKKEIEFNELPLRELAKLTGETSPQKIKHHLLQLIKYGYVDIIKGKYKVNSNL